MGSLPCSLHAEVHAVVKFLLVFLGVAGRGLSCPWLCYGYSYFLGPIPVMQDLAGPADDGQRMDGGVAAA